MVKQKTDAYCRGATTQVRTNESKFDVYHNRRIVRTSKIYGNLQKIMTVALGEHIHHVKHYASIAGRRSERRMYETMQKKLFWLHAVNGVYRTVSKCATRTRNRDQLKQKRHLQILPAARTLKTDLWIFSAYRRQQKRSSRYHSDEELLLEKNNRDPYVQDYSRTYCKCVSWSLDRSTRYKSRSSERQRAPAFQQGFCIIMLYSRTASLENKLVRSPVECESRKIQRKYSGPPSILRRLAPT